jgi:hypothetical protein
MGIGKELDSLDFERTTEDLNTSTLPLDFSLFLSFEEPNE